MRCYMGSLVNSAGCVAACGQKDLPQKPSKHRQHIWIDTVNV